MWARTILVVLSDLLLDGDLRSCWASFTLRNIKVTIVLLYYCALQLIDLTIHCVQC